MFNENVWRSGENLVVEYLKKKGYKIVYQNFHCKIAELDIVAVCSKKLQKRAIKSEFLQKIKQLDNKNEKTLLRYATKNKLKNLVDVLVVVEVKSRSNLKFGTGLDAISREKIEHMKRGGDVLLKKKEFKNMQIRFDVASVDSGEITYIEAAF